MFCTKCGNQNSDGALFCLICGSSFAANAPGTPGTVQQAPQMQQPMNQVPPSYNASQPMNQPPQFQGQPMQGQLLPYGAPAKKPKTVPIIIGIIGALITAFLIVLFMVILPGSSTKGKINYAWSFKEGGEEWTLDFKNNEMKSDGYTFPISWSLSGDTLTITEYSPDDRSTELFTDEFTVSFSSGGKVMTLTYVDNPSNTMTLNRKD